MDIAGIWKSLSGIVPLEHGGGNGRPLENAGAEVAGQQAPALSPQSQHVLHEIVSRYDVTQISPRDFSQLVQELKHSNVLADTDVQRLASLRVELDQQGLDPDEPVDLTELLQHKLQNQERELERQERKQGVPIDRTTALQETLAQMDWIQKFALLERSGNYLPLDTVV